MIIAYASANADPLNYPTDDADVDLASATLPHDVDFFGQAVDTADPSASFSWSWTLLDGDATISSATTQNITVTVKGWRNVLLHLVATNTATGETSETNTLLSPTASFTVARVLSASHGLERPAKGERGWHEALLTWGNVLDNSASSLTELSDVTTSTGAQLDILTSGSNAVDGGSALHTHLGSHVAVASNTAQGTLALESAWHTGGAVPKALVYERLCLTGGADYSVSGGSLTSKIIFQSSSTTQLLPHVVFQAVEELTVTHVSFVLIDGGVSSAVGDYVFDLCYGSAQKLGDANMTHVGLDLSGTIASDYAPLVITHTLGTPLTISAGNFVGVALRNSPVEGDAGRCLQVTLRAVREV